MADQFASIIARVVELQRGEPFNPAQSRPGKGELRWGSKGSLSVDTRKGVYHNHEAARGGGVLDYLWQECGMQRPEALDWLRSERLIPDENPNKANGHANGHHAPEPRRCVARYDYVDEGGDTLFQVRKWSAGQRFSQHAALPDGSFAPDLGSARRVLYRLPEVIEAAALGRRVLVVEGEKDADRWAALGVVATCNPMGAGKWDAAYSETLRDAAVVVIPDNDEAGKRHADRVAKALDGIAASVRVVELPGLAAKGDSSDWIDAGNGVAELDALLEDRPPPFRSRYGAVPYSEVFARLRPDVWRWHRALLSSGVSFIYGAPGSGKSFFAISLGMAIARGIDFLGRRTLPGLVIYIAAEAQGGIIKRLAAYGLHHRVGADEDVSFVALSKSMDLLRPDADIGPVIEEIEAIAKARGMPVAMIAIDTVASSTPGLKENASEDMGRFLSHLRRMREKFECHVVGVHHVAKGSEIERGHGSLRGDADTMIHIETDERGNRSWTIDKQREGQDHERGSFRLQVVEVLRDEEGEPTTSCVAVESDADPARATRQTKIDPRTMNALRALREAIEEVGIEAPNDLRLPVGTRVVNRAQWIEAMERRGLLVGEGESTTRGVGKRHVNPATLRQRYQASQDRLVAAGYIQISLPWVWCVRG